MISMSEIWMLVLLVAGLIIALIIYGIGYSKGYDDGKEYQRKEIENILKTFKGEWMCMMIVIKI